LVALFVVVVVEVANASRQAQEALDQTELATASVGPSGLMSALQDERNWASIDLIGQGDFMQPEVAGYEDTRRQTDEAIEEFRAEIEKEGGPVEASYRPALDGLADLQELRDDIDANENPHTMEDNTHFTNDIFQRYANIINVFNQGNSRVAAAVDDPDLRLGAELIDTIARQGETGVQLQAEIMRSVLVPDPVVTRDEIRRIASFADTHRRQAAAILDGASGPYQASIERIFPAEFNERLLAAADRAIIDHDVDIQAMLDDIALQEEQGQSYFIFQDVIAEDLQNEADRIAGEAQDRVTIYRWLAVAALIVTGIAVFLVSRSITRPLRSLTDQAREMANRRLPDAVLDVLDRPLGEDVVVPNVVPIAVPSKDEVGEVAEAINVAQTSALSLAVEQAMLRRNIADSFVNLGRRNQHLLGRQLDFITELEVNETDPDVLSNLFRLDHLATRMRRNAESLLLLAGVEPPRKWAVPVRMTDCIRAALGEVEDYPRVVDRGVEPATLVGSAAADVAHLLAELIDNALIYSPPNQAVEVRGRLRPDGYTLAIVDAGLGMSPDELDRANRRLAGAESFTIAPSKYLGHYVAGNLAARHNIRVSLHSAPGTGITATVSMPPTLMSTNEQTSLPPVQSQIPGPADAPPYAPPPPSAYPAPTY
jgi:signal transduction histidine kinase